MLSIVDGEFAELADNVNVEVLLIVDSILFVLSSLVDGLGAMVLLFVVPPVVGELLVDVFPLAVVATSVVDTSSMPFVKSLPLELAETIEALLQIAGTTLVVQVVVVTTKLLVIVVFVVVVAVVQLVVMEVVGVASLCKDETVVVCMSFAVDFWSVG